MKMRLPIIVMFLTAMTAGVADAEWDWWKAEPQKFQSFEDHVIAVGTTDMLESVNATDIRKALADGKEIRLAYAEIVGALTFSGQIRRDVYSAATTFAWDADFSSATFTGNVYFSSATFTGDAYFGDTTFTGNAIFRGVTFSGYAIFVSANFSGCADFISATFARDASFSSAEFTGEADLISATFTGNPISRGVTFTRNDFGSRFTGDADFISDTFTGNAIFREARFSEYAIFVSASFSGYADFISATFARDANFSYAKFTVDVDFISATFTADADFSSAAFEKSSGFTGCAYSEKSTISFEDVTGFSQMKIEWERNGSSRGLRGHLEYDETFYIALIKNYREMGWLSQADDTYYTYRQEKRKRRNAIYSGAELVFLEIPFGYGVKPWKLLRSFLIVWILFSLYYSGFLRNPGEWFSHGIRLWRPFRDSFRCLAWAGIHSLNILTPGIDLQPMRSMETSQYELVKSKSKRVVWVQRFQQIIGWYLLALFLVMFGKIWVR